MDRRIEDDQRAYSVERLVPRHTRYLNTDLFLVACVLRASLVVCESLWVRRRDGSRSLQPSSRATREARLS